MLELCAMTNLIHFFSVIHFTALAGLAIYGTHRLWMLYHWRRYAVDAGSPAPKLSAPDQGQQVTVQLPLYNEQFVAERLIDAVARLDWPADCLQIQVLDDSTDATSALVDKAVSRWQQQGINIVTVRRSERRGYKAGALAEALPAATGDFIAIFDADFIPDTDYLLRMMPYFDAADVGMVQARWGFLNREQSWLTQIQAILLGPHFGIEHQVRFRQGVFFNFNGTAGIWRRQAITAAGGWQADTVTEDLDLSYRAQLAGWRFIYANDIVVPSELPVTLNDFRGQQQRWAKGSMQTARKILPLMLTSKQPWAVKCEALVHLLANLGWMCGALASLTLYPALVGCASVDGYQLLLLDAPLFLLAFVAILLYFFVYAYSEVGWRSLAWLPVLPLLTMGLAPTLAWAALSGLVQRGGVFNRTAKYGARDDCKGDKVAKAKTNLVKLVIVHGKVSGKVSKLLLLNGILTLYTCLPVLCVIQRGALLAIPGLLLFPLGFAVVFLQDLRESIAFPSFDK